MTEIEKWAKKLQRLLKQMPSGYEGVVSYNSIEFYKEGTLNEHMVEDSGFEIRDASICSVKTEYKIIPYSEGT